MAASDIIVSIRRSRRLVACLSAVLVAALLIGALMFGARHTVRNNAQAWMQAAGLICSGGAPGQGGHQHCALCLCTSAAELALVAARITMHRPPAIARATVLAGSRPDWVIKSRFPPARGPPAKV